MAEKFKRSQKKIILICLCFTVSGWLEAENVRGPVKQVLELEVAEDYSRQLTLSAGELIGLKLKEDSPLLIAIDLELVMTDKLKQYADSFTLELYDAVSPEPKPDQVAFTGSRIFSQILPYMNTIELEIPYVRLSQKQNSPGSYTLSKTLGSNNFPLLFTVQTILKGIPDSVLLTDFHLKVKTRLLKKGYLDLKISSPAAPLPQEMELYIDDRRQSRLQGPLLLDTGIHSLLLTADHFQAENSSFLIETGKTTRLELTLEAVGARVQIERLPGTQVYLDGLKLESIAAEGIILPEGDHTFRFKIGDYSVSKSLYIVEGKSYNVSLFLSVEVKEN